MNNPLKNTKLSQGLILRDMSGSVLDQSLPVERDPSRQLTLNEYATLKNSEGGLGSHRFGEGKDKSISHLDRQSDERSLYSRIKPDSAQ